MLAIELLVVVVGIVLLAGVLKSGGRRSGGETAVSEAENLRLRDEVKDLKERVKVLERIATDRENTLERQIEELRDR